MLAITNVNLIDGTGRQPTENAVIIIDNGVITKTGTDIPVPEGIDVINAKGMTAIPALSDAHTHFSGSSFFERPPLGRREKTYDYSEAREACLRWGVLTVRTAGDIVPTFWSIKGCSGREDNIPQSSGRRPYVSGSGGHPLNTVFMSDEEIEKNACIIIDDDTDIESAVKAVCEMGVDWIKVFYAHINKMDYPNYVPRLSRSVLERVIRAAHRLGKPVMVPVDDPDEMLEAAMSGADCIEHMIGVGAGKAQLSLELIELLKSRNVTVVPTMVSIQRFDDKLEGAAPVWEDLKAAVKKLKDAGVPLAVGCDSGIPLVGHGEGVHDELMFFVEAGFTPREAICAATLGNAKLLQMDDKTGSLEPGKMADVILLGSNPLEDISNTKDIRLVIMEGRVVFDNLR